MTRKPDYRNNSSSKPASCTFYMHSSMPQTLYHQLIKDCSCESQHSLHLSTVLLVILRLIIPSVDNRMSITEGSLFQLFPYYVFQFCSYPCISSNYICNFVFVPTNRQGCHMVCYSQINTQETLVPKMTHEFRDVCLHLPKTQDITQKRVAVTFR
jgi:hypothetical protein